MSTQRLLVPALAVVAVGAGVALANPTDAHAASKTCNVRLPYAEVIELARAGGPPGTGILRVRLTYSDIVSSQRVVTRCREVTDSVRNAISRYVSQTAAFPLPRTFSTGWYRTRWRLEKRVPEWVAFVGRFQAADNPGHAKIVYTVKFRGPVRKNCTATLNPRVVANGGRVTGRLRYQNINPLQLGPTKCSTAVQSMKQALHHYLAGDRQNPFPTNAFDTRWRQVPGTGANGTLLQIAFVGRSLAADNAGMATLTYRIPLRADAPRRPVLPQ